MIHAKLNGKSHVEEDNLTSSVFGTLLHLPTELFWKIISEACNDEAIPQNVGKLQECEFWSHWDSENTGNKNLVEPDVFLRFENFDVIVEAKRYDEKQQYSGQWAKEYQAYLNEYEADGKQVFFLAVGGVYSHETQEVENTIKVYQVKWTNILDAVSEFRRGLEKSEHLTNNIDATLYTLSILVKVLEMYGFFKTTWFENISVKNKDITYQSLNSWDIGKFHFNINNYSIKNNIKLWEI